MQASKSAHLAFLLEASAPASATRSHGLAAQARQAQLLEEHNRCVAAFATAVRALASADPAAHAALIAHLTTLNLELGGPQAPRH